MYKNLKVVVIGGGTGLSSLLRGLKNDFEKLTAVVTMADDGRSTGSLRHDLNVLPPGDIRSCIVALSDEEHLYHKLLSYRFPHGRGLKGHNLGNLLLIALEDITGSFKKAIGEFSKILAIKGQVMPSTYEDAIISAKLANGRVVWGESTISVAGHRSSIKQVQLHPESAKANPDAVKAIEKADVILIGPGSLYTSIIPNFLLKEICRAVASSRAKKIFICNISTERGETEGYAVADHIKTLTGHSDPQIFDICLVNSKLILKSSGKRLGEVKNITTDEKTFGRYKIEQANIIDEKKPLYHDSEKLAKVIIKLVQ
ncbi:MAG: gluconeogenesis factor YvcK family protein [Patescibacteria group bacterium]|jgi:uncharacterized cofD-like protein